MEKKNFHGEERLSLGETEMVSIYLSSLESYLMLYLELLQSNKCVKSQFDERAKRIIEEIVNGVRINIGDGKEQFLNFVKMSLKGNGKQKRQKEKNQYCDGCRSKPNLTKQQNLTQQNTELSKIQSVLVGKITKIQNKSIELEKRLAYLNSNLATPFHCPPKQALKSPQKPTQPSLKLIKCYQKQYELIKDEIVGLSSFAAKMKQNLMSLKKCVKQELDEFTIGPRWQAASIRKLSEKIIQSLSISKQRLNDKNSQSKRVEIMQERKKDKRKESNRGEEQSQNESLELGRSKSILFLERWKSCQNIISEFNRSKRSNRSKSIIFDIENQIEKQQLKLNKQIGLIRQTSKLI